MMRTIAIACSLVAIAAVARADGEADAIAAMQRCDDVRAHCFQIALHVVASGDGSGSGGGLVQTPAWLGEQVANANKFFAAVDTGFDVASVDGLPAELAHVVTRDDRDALAARVTDAKIHVFVVERLEDVDHVGDKVFGVTWRAAGKTYVIVAADAYARTTAHELGHVFGLPHSAYAISIMNKSARDQPPPEQRRFADEELAAMRPVIARISRRHLIEERAAN